MSKTEAGSATAGNEGAETFRDRFESGDDAKPWLDAIKQAQEHFSPFNDMCDKIDRLYACLEEAAGTSKSSKMAIFWANLQTLGPAIYSRPPEPAVAPAFKDRRPLPRAASEVMERALMTSVRKERMHRQMKLIRDDVARHGRGVMWVRMTEQERRTGPHKRMKYDHLNRKDFLHEPARNWDEVGWCAKRAWLTKDKMVSRFGKERADEAKYEDGENRTAKGYTIEKQAEVWEIWSQTEGLVAWVSPGMDVVLDIKPPTLDLEDFYPCPEPAYGTVEPDTLRPVPDFAQYRDQIDDIDRLTNRISALSDALKLRGFYPKGAEDIGEAVKKAISNMDDRATMEGIPLPPGAVGIGKMIEWMPIREIAETIKFLVEERRQLIEDVEQVVGISDIMRGATEASETATAQQLKAQYGNVRVRDKSEEVARIAEDGLKVSAEIMAEHFDPQFIQELSQTDLPTDAQLQEQFAALQQQASKLPEDQHAELQKQVDELKETITFDQVMQLLRNERMRPFVLEVRTDSTIRPNEDAEKQRRNEFMGALGAFFKEAVPIVQAVPAMAPFMGELLQFLVAPYRPDRQMQQAIDDLVDELQGMAKQASEPKPPPPELEIEQHKLKQGDRKLDIDEMKVKADAVRGQQGQGPAQPDPVAMFVAQERAKADAARLKQDGDIAREQIASNEKIAAMKISADREKAQAPLDRQAETDESIWELVGDLRDDIAELKSLVQPN